MRALTPALSGGCCLFAVLPKAARLNGLSNVLDSKSCACGVCCSVLALELVSQTLLPIKPSKVPISISDWTAPTGRMMGRHDDNKDRTQYHITSAIGVLLLLDLLT